MTLNRYLESLAKNLIIDEDERKGRMTDTEAG